MNIKVRDLKQTETIKNSDKLMVLVDDDLNLVKNVTKEEFLTNVISESENNALVQETDGNLYVNTSEISDSITELDERVTAIDTKFTNQIGDLNDLVTENKTNLVAAINEATTEKAQAAWAAMPSDKYIDLTAGQTGSNYTAPANGYFTIVATSTTAFSWTRLFDNTTRLSSQQTSYQSGNGMSIFLPARKNKSIALSYLNASINTLRFVYANGEV